MKYNIIYMPGLNKNIQKKKYKKIIKSINLNEYILYFIMFHIKFYYEICRHYFYNFKKVLFPREVTLDPDDCLVLVLDAIEDYISLFSKYNIDSINDLTYEAESKDVPIVFTKWNRIIDSKIDDIFNKKANWVYFIPKEAKLIKTLYVPINAEIILTKFVNAFSENMSNVKLIDLLGKRKNLIICGSWTEACVYQTAFHAAENNINPYILSPGTVGISKYSSFSKKIDMESNFSYIVKRINFKKK